ncbi:hypothetical protein PG984_012301 [Apiospora sp. TS-2023a]
MSGSRNTMAIWQEWSAEEDLSMTSRYLFTMTRPTLSAQESKHPGTTWGKGFIEIARNDIEEWTDFTEGNANDAFCKVLDAPISQGIHLVEPLKALDDKAVIVFEEHLDDYFLKVIGPILSHSIECTREQLCEVSDNAMALKLRIPYSKEAIRVSLPNEEGEGAKLKRPNFPIYLPAKSMPGMKPPNDVVFVIGETARTMVWDPNCYKHPKNYKENGRIHLGKVAMYCKAAKTCLAFTMTTEGVTMFRFFTIENEDGTERWGVQLATFPWCPKWHRLPAENEMSAAKAIWVSIMMSLDPEARRIQRRVDIRSLESWPRFEIKKTSTPDADETMEEIDNGFSFKFGNNFTPASFFHVKLSKEDEERYMHPFNCEARAYARLKEANKEHITVPCYGYIMLNQEQQAILRAKDTAHSWTDDWCYHKVHAGQPLKALVKEFIDFKNLTRPDLDNNLNIQLLVPAIDSHKTARTLFNNMATLHRLGILQRDINASNVVKGRFLDFSCSWTKPHPCLDTKQIESAKSPYDQLGVSDADALDAMIDIWNEYQPHKLRMWLRAAANHKYLERLRSYANRYKDRDPYLWEWTQCYRGRPDLYDWEGSDDLDAKQRKRDSRRHYRSRKKQVRQIRAQDCPKA